MQIIRPTARGPASVWMWLTANPRGGGAFGKIEIAEVDLAMVQDRAPVKTDQQGAVEWQRLRGLKKRSHHVHAVLPRRPAKHADVFVFDSPRVLAPSLLRIGVRGVEGREAVRKGFRKDDNIGPRAARVCDHRDRVAVVQVLH